MEGPSISQHKVTACAINASGEWLAFGASELGQLLVWEWQSESYILRQQGHAYPPTALAYSPEGQTIVTGGEDSRVKLWNVASGFCFVTFTEHSAPVTAVQFAQSGQVVVSASKDGTVRAFDLLRYRNFRYGRMVPQRARACCLPLTDGVRQSRSGCCRHRAQHVHDAQALVARVAGAGRFERTGGGRLGGLVRDLPVVAADRQAAGRALRPRRPRNVGGVLAVAARPPGLGLLGQDVRPAGDT